jgi:hypothetical protein
MNIALPIDGLNILWRVIAVALTLYLSLIIKWVNGSVLQRSVIYQVLFLLASIFRESRGEESGRQIRVSLEG